MSVNCSSQKDPGLFYHLQNVINHRNVVRKPEMSVTACEDFFELACEAHICTGAMQGFKMSLLDDTPSTTHFPEGCMLLNPKQRWNVLQLAIKDIVEQFVDIDYPSSASSVAKDDDHVHAYAKEVTRIC